MVSSSSRFIVVYISLLAWTNLKWTSIKLYTIIESANWILHNMRSFLCDVTQIKYENWIVQWKFENPVPFHSIANSQFENRFYIDCVCVYKFNIIYCIVLSFTLIHIKWLFHLCIYCICICICIAIAYWIRFWLLYCWFIIGIQMHSWHCITFNLRILEIWTNKWN